MDAKKKKTARPGGGSWNVPERGLTLPGDGC